MPRWYNSTILKIKIMKSIIQKVTIVVLLLVTVLFAYACYTSMQETTELVSLTLGVQ